ncbi:MAG: DegT/DnrJ/EryC1/StrS family aminotransferase, partial [Phycisphaerae bacterium]|nr:DegT/DnrJ/EryC1/StrS family aminotransferase [Phycisphaerae bacterium]
AMQYRGRRSEIEEVIPLSEPPYVMTHAWHLFIVRLDLSKARLTRDEFMERLKQRNIGTGLHFRAIHLQKYYRETMGIRRGMLPNTEWNSDRICSLPLFPDMTSDDVDDVVNAVKDVLYENTVLHRQPSWNSGGDKPRGG